MIDFKPFTLADKPWMEELIKMSGFQSEEYNFNFMFMWQDVFHYQAARLGDYLLLRADIPGRSSYLYPPGSGDIKPAIDALIQDAQDRGNPMVFHTVLTQQVKLLEVLYPNQFVFTPLSDYFDYVYDAQSIITLAGKKLHSKRNHINRFKELNPDWSYEPITAENMPQVRAMSAEWCQINECMSTKTGREEICAVGRALDNYFALGLEGGLIRTGGKVVAFTIGERLNHDTYLVHIEKAFSEIQGAYAIINQEFASRHCQDVLYINREDDSGQPGLRKAKQSYRPVFQVEKHAARLKWYDDSGDKPADIQPE